MSVGVCSRRLVLSWKVCVAFCNLGKGWGLEFALHLANRQALNASHQPMSNSWTACTPLQLQQICSFLRVDDLLVGLVFIHALSLYMAHWHLQQAFHISNVYLARPKADRGVKLIRALVNLQPGS
jgi:hypothetical protein